MQFENLFVLGADSPLDALPPQGTIQAGYLRGLKDLIRSRGADPRRILEHHDIDPLAFDDPDNHVDCIAAVNLLEHCSRLLQDPVFGMHLAELQSPDAFGCATALARAAPTLRQGLQALVDYVPLSTSPECEMEVAMARDIVELRWRTNTGLGDSEQSNYQGLLLIMKTLQMLGGERFRPRYASLTFPVGRPDMQLLQDRLGCRINGRSEDYAIAFSADLLDQPIATSNRLLFSLLGTYLAQLRGASRSDFVEQVASYVRGALSTGHCSVDGCAKELGTSTRTLQKRLLRAGGNFSDIVQSERVKLAKHALLWTDRTLDEIAFQLGYSEQTSFGRAFKRSTGMTPQAFRSTEHRSCLAAQGELNVQC